jgi:hypothetical protein
VLAVDLAHQVVVDVRLPRHLGSSSSFSGGDFSRLAAWIARGLG